MKKYKSPLDWEYCECGCHCFEVSIGGITFSNFIYWPLNNEREYDYDKPPSCRLSFNGYTDGGTFSSWKELDSKVFEILNKRNTELKLKEDLKSLQKLRKSCEKM